jgi:TRAP-type mannitol/chloroaromatic compound transport system permease small subunit
MERFLSRIDAIHERLGNIIGWLVVPVMLLTIYEVISRFVFHHPTLWAHDMTSFVFGFYAVTLGGYVLLYNQHIRVDILWNRLSPRGQAIADLITSILGISFIGVLLVYSIPWAWDSLLLRERSFAAWRPPIYPIKISVVIGAFLFFIQIMVKFVRDLQIASKRAKPSER